MNNKKFAKATQAVLLVLMVCTIVFCCVAAPTAQASGYSASYIQKLDNGLKLDVTDYLDGSVAFRLPDSVGKDEEISVIITLDSPALMDVYEGTDKAMSFTQFATTGDAAANAQNRVEERKAQILSKLDESDVAYTTGETYSTLFSGFEVIIKAGDYEATCKALKKGENAVIGQVYKVAETKLVENTVNVYETGIFKSGDSGYDGTGMVVAVLDTGLDSAHTAFSVNNFTSNKLGLTYADVAAVLNKTEAYELSGGLAVDDVYINEKVPFGYDYADNDPDVYSTHNNHGTHVSGVIVGKDDVITGVAPNAQLVSMKVFSDVMDTARSSWILAALEDCVVLGVDVINMSLGTACGFSHESEEELLSGVYQRIRENGIGLIVAASNSFSSAYGSEKNGNLGLTSNPDTGTVGSPGTYAGAMSVASINGEETPYIKYKDTIIYFDESTNGSSKENDFFDTLLGDAQSKEYEFVTIPGVGRSADYSGMDVTGKIVLVRRGDNTFEEKAMIAESKGAAGIIIYNNVSGEIKMNVGDAKLAVCSITQDDGKMLAAVGSGKLVISKSQTSGPFISDFSSWGPGPNLEIKPEITAHGGNILSSVTGGGYDRLSGTSMACPNLAGVVILLRQYVVENFPEIANDNVAVNAMVNRLMMSTADIALNTNGLPYAVRKQGAGLANLLNSIKTPAYITTYDENGNAMDKTKLELGDDPQKTGVYEMSFDVNNIGDKTLTYTLGGYVFTEGVSDTKTNAGETTVTESAYILDGAKIEIVSVDNGTLKGSKITVKGGEAARVKVKITLSQSDKDYLNRSFQNGMYVEGFITLKANSGTSINLNVPYLAFFGDWTKAPLFDLDYFETDADERDDSIAVEDKVMADAYPSRPIGGLYDDYVSYLGSYYFLQDPKDMIISANRDYIALSNKDGTIHSLRFVWAGLLRNAAKIEISITDDTTGEVIYETVDDYVRKSYGDGGSIYPANVEIEFDTQDYNLPNNSEYTVKLVGYLDTGDGALETNEKNTFEFPFTVDFEAPTVSDVEFYYEYDKTQEKNRLYAKVGIYDNHFAMCAQLGYVAMGQDDNGNATPELLAFEQYMTPVYSKEDSTTYVTFELTDYIYDIKENALNDKCFVVTCYDYAMNYATYEIGLPTDYVDFIMDGMEGELTLSPNEVYTLEPLIMPEDGWSELLEYTSSRPSVVRVVNNKLVAVNSGKAIIRVRDPKTNKSTTFNVTVLKEGDEGYRRYDKPVADVFSLTGYQTLKAYYMLNSEDKLIGDSGDKRFFEGNYALTMYPSESVQLRYELDAYFPNDTTVEFSSGNEEIVTIDQNGVLTAVAEGFSSVTIKVLQDGRSTYYSESVSIEVKDPYVTTGASLTHYYGNGGLVVVPDRLNLTEIGNFAFANFDYVMKTEEELAFDDAEKSKQWYIGDATVTKVVLPEGIEKIGAYAFANLTALEEIELPSTLEAIEYGAFYGCASLEKITFRNGNNLKIINQSAFEGCDLQGTLELPAICMISNYAFAGNRNLKGVTTADALLSIGQYAFAGCEKLENVTITSGKVKYGIYAFTGCDSLKSFTVNAAVVPDGMFYECANLESVIIGADVNTIGEFAFRDTKISQFTVAEGNSVFKSGTADHILSADGKTLMAVAPSLSGSFTEANLAGAEVTAIGNSAFSHNTALTFVDLPKVTVVGDYAFGADETKNLGINSVNLGVLTHIGEYAFFGTGITQVPAFADDAQIGKYAFSYSDITSVKIPAGMTVAEGTFSECVYLEKVEIGDNVILGEHAFSLNFGNAASIRNYNENGEKYFHYHFSSKLQQLTIGSNVTIGDHAFQNAASLQSVTLGENATIGYMAFYNNTELKNIDLSKAASIGDYAFSGDVHYVCLDEAMSYAAVSTESTYIYSYHAPALEKVDLSAVQSVGENAFAYCRDLTDVVLGEAITEIAQYTFAGCISLENINMDKVTTIGDYVFMETEKLATVTLSAIQNIGEYAFVNSKGLQKVILNENGCQIEEGAFAYCAQLDTVENMAKVQSIGDYAFAYTALTAADLSAAQHIGTHAFLKEKLTDFTVTLSENLVTMGDNPFAVCHLEPFCQKTVNNFNGVDYEKAIYTYDISDTVKVVEGSLYCKMGDGYELITYAGINPVDMQVAEDTIRITAMAFAGSDVQMVTMPYSTTSIGHKAFFACPNLHTVVFGSYNAPILEEEFDPAYYESLEHMPGTGDFGTFEDYSGNQFTITGMGLIPYYMWNSTDGMYSNVFYGANFVNYVGYVQEKLTMVRPANGQNYDSYIYSQYFDLTIDGDKAPDDVTLAAIAAIKAIPERVTYAHKEYVEQARAAYTKIATIEQQALVLNYSQLISAEQRIVALTPEEPVPDVPVEDTDDSGSAWIWILVVVVVCAGGAVCAVILLKKYKGIDVMAWCVVQAKKGAAVAKKAIGQLREKLEAKKNTKSQEASEAAETAEQAPEVTETTEEDASESNEETQA